MNMHYKYLCQTIRITYDQILLFNELSCHDRCIFELYTANSNDECKVTVVMPPREKDRLIDVLRRDGSLDELYNTFGKTKVENADASQVDDKNKILGMIEKGPGYDELNIDVNRFLREWVLEQTIETADYFDANRHLSTDKELISFFYNIALVLSKHGDASAAIKYFQISLEIDESQHDKNVKSIANRYIQIGETLREQGRYDDALAKVQTGISMLEEEFGQGSPEVCLAYNNAGLILFNKGDTSGAMAYYEAAIEGQKQATGESHPDFAVFYSNLGLLFGKQGNHEMALDYFQRSIAIYEKEAEGTNALSIASVYNNIGSIYFDQAKYEEALIEFEKSLIITLKLIGTQNDTLLTYNNRAMTYRAMGKIDLAKKEYEKAISLIEDLFGEENGTIPLLLNNYGEVQIYEGELDSGLETLYQAEKLYRHIFGEYHPDRAKPISNISLALAKKGQVPEAIKSQGRAILIQEKAYGKEHVDLATSYSNLANFYFSIGQYNEGVKLFEQSKQILRKIVGEKHPLYGKVLNDLAVTYEASNDLENALINFQAAATFEETMGNGELESISVFFNLGSLQNRIGKRDEAIATMQKAKVCIEKGELPKKEVMLINVAFEIAKIYFEEGRYDDALLIYNGLFEEKKFTSNTEIQEAMAYVQQGMIHRVKSDFESATKSYQKAFDLRKKILGINDPQTAIASNDLGLMKYYMNDYNGAMAQHKFTIYLHESNGRTVDVASSYFNYGLALFKANKTKRALSFTKKAYIIWKESFGAEDENTKLAAENMKQMEELIENVVS